MVAGGARDGSSTASTPATTSSVPTREQLRERWTCQCEALQLVRPVVPGSHTAAAVMCPKREKRGTGTGLKVGDVQGVLAHGIRVGPADMPKNVREVWTLVSRADVTACVTWAVCTKLRRAPNPDYAMADDDQMRDTSIPKTILLPAPWESWGLRAQGMAGVWAGWSGEAPTPDVFKVRGVDGFLTVTEALKIIKSR